MVERDSDGSPAASDVARRRSHFAPRLATVWPPLPLDEWANTYATVHMLTQIVGKIRLACAPMVNHWWHVALYVTARGLTTSAMPHGTRIFQIDFDFHDHVLNVDAGNRACTIELRARPIAEYYNEVMDALRALDVPVRIWPRPVEVEDTVPFDRDFRSRDYVPEHAHRCWQVLAQASRVMADFRSGFIGKCSPVHFFWGGFDLAVTRFSGRRAPEHPGGIPNLADRVTREAYSHECSSCGFWPGSGAVREPAFYAYAYPEPDGFREYPISPNDAYYSADMHEYLLPYEAVRRASDPDRMILDFFQSTYDACAELAHWNRAGLERAGPGAGREKAPAPAFPRHDEET